MPIPDLNENGLLPEGVHDCTLKDKAMRDGADKEKPLLGQTIECVVMMYRSLQSLYENE